ncbi:MAG: ribonuclease Z [Planctomycetota bacterium]|jgi:ribonuclease Z
MTKRTLNGELILAGHRVRALSIGGQETCIDLPDLKVAFDVGRSPQWLTHRKTILFTHSHVDHMSGIISHCAMRGLLNVAPPTYVVPRESVAGLELAFKAWRLLDGSDLAHDLVPIGPGDEYPLSPRLFARAFRSHHSAPCQGYVLVSVNKKLKPEYRELSSEAIRDLRLDEGVEVSEEVQQAEVVFVGDTRIEVVEQEPVVRTARLLILEVTFLDDRVSIEQAREMGHIHLDEVIERTDLFENEAILFTHFSARYRAPEIAKILKDKLPPSLRERVTPLLTGHGPMEL